MSWLIRCWEEPREAATQEEPVLRCYIRDLRTGEEHYLSDPQRVGELILRQMRPELKETSVEKFEAELGQNA